MQVEGGAPHSGPRAPRESTRTSWEAQCPGILLTFPLCPAQGFPLSAQQTAQSVPQTTQQVLGEAHAETSLRARPSSLLRAGCQVILLLLLPS